MGHHLGMLSCVAASEVIVRPLVALRSPEGDALLYAHLGHQATDIIILITTGAAPSTGFNLAVSLQSPASCDAGLKNLQGKHRSQFGKIGL